MHLGHILLAIPLGVLILVGIAIFCAPPRDKDS